MAPDLQDGVDLSTRMLHAFATPAAFNICLIRRAVEMQATSAAHQ